MFRMPGQNAENAEVALLPKIANAGWTAVPDFNPAIAGEALQRLAQRGPGDAQLGGQFPFGR
jgi:hypothetical protein